LLEKPSPAPGYVTAGKPFEAEGRGFESLWAHLANPELEWLEKTYRPNEPQLTVRAVLLGMVIGAVMCLSNLYVVLKTGWSIGVTVVSCIVGWAVLSGLKVLRFTKKPLGQLENNAIGDVASAAGYMTGGGNMAALPALVMLTGIMPNAWVVVLWFAGIAVLGVFAAIPIKRQLINQEQLPFPTGTATAETIRALHAKDERGAQQARWLGIAGLSGALIAWFRDANLSWMPFRIPSTFGPTLLLKGKPLSEWTLAVEGSTLMLGAGALMSFRAGWSLLLGAGLSFGLIAPAMYDAGVITSVGYKPIVGWTVWMGAAVLVSSGLTSFAFQWKSVVRSVTELMKLLRPKRATDAEDPLAAIEAPASWFPIGFLVFGPPVVFLGWYAFDIPLWAGAIALPLSVLMGVIAARVTGETDVTPTKALGPVTQLIFAVLLPKALVPNIMSANITGGVGLHAADLLTDLKSGYLLGARPRQQLIGQLFGVIAGSLAVVPAFMLLVPSPDVLGSKEFPAPAALVWANVSKMLVAGIDALHPTARWAALVGVVVGTLLAILEVKVPKKAKAWVPSPSGLGIAMVIPAYNSIMMFVGAALAEWYRRKKGDQTSAAVVVPVASGFIAGESLMGILVKMLVAFGVMPKG
jgi:OPT family oligopeptide transporter